MWKQCPDKRIYKTCGSGSHLSANHRDNFKKFDSNNNNISNNKRKESSNNASNNNVQTKRNSGKIIISLRRGRI
jgi:hypothetical protein